MTISGRGDGGSHRFYRRPPGRLSDARLGPGIDIKTSLGYTVHAPSYPSRHRPPVRPDRPSRRGSAGLADQADHARARACRPTHIETSIDLLVVLVGRASPTNSARPPRGPRSSSRTDGAVSTPIRTLTARSGCTRPTPRRARPRSGSAACSSGRRTPRSRSANRQTLTATPSFAHTRCSITTATCPPRPEHCREAS